MKEIEIIRSKEKITIIWQSAEVNIPLEDILKVNKNYTIIDTTKVVKIGEQFQSSEAIFIKTKKLDYLLFTTNKLTLLNQILL
ncbi:hypothetical protein M3Y14_32975 (plasmid) [Bacillus thuringiensis]|uniref:SunI/YnzG family protein n=1 Tax=Bacillus thuringiensis TaxID=1428 RepID=UPI0022254B5A|nr:hypothetical protein [Bacillus thuringiensis]UYX55838.1 hypothetical protein M3Y14_32975 [Bacillus thuringiensis]